jgi:hypothetical protein
VDISDHSELQFSFFKDFDDVHHVWSQIATEDILTQSEYLRLTTQGITQDIIPYFCIVSENDIPKYGLIFQLKKITLSESIRADSNNPFVNGFKALSKSIVERFFNVYTLISGNLYVTGEYSFVSNTKMNHTDILDISKKAASLLGKEIKAKENKNVGIFLFKDFYTNRKDLDIPDIHCDLTQFSVQPNMVFDVREDWNTFEDYLNSFKSKYRVRYRRAQKKNEAIEVRELNIEDIKFHLEEINELYLNVSGNAGFNLFILSPDYFLKLKEALGDKCKISGYFHEGKLVSFCSVILNHTEVEAHFLGYDLDLNREYQLYLNMLYNIVGVAIKEKKATVNFSRTALEIKSSVGATPRQMNIYLKHKNRFVNRLLPYLLKFFTPKYELVERSPF